MIYLLHLDSIWDSSSVMWWFFHAAVPQDFQTQWRRTGCMCESAVEKNNIAATNAKTSAHRIVKIPVYFYVLVMMCTVWGLVLSKQQQCLISAWWCSNNANVNSNSESLQNSWFDFFVASKLILESRKDCSKEYQQDYTDWSLYIGELMIFLCIMTHYIFRTMWLIISATLVAHLHVC